MNRPRELAMVLLNKARGDLRALECLSTAPGIPGWVTGFHAQQAVEKSVKAVLAACGSAAPPVHDLERLLQVARDAGVELPVEAADFPTLTAFAALWRYDDDMEDISNPPSSIGNAIQLARLAVAWAERAIG